MNTYDSCNVALQMLHHLIKRCSSSSHEKLITEWEKLATKQMKGKKPESLVWKTTEGIDVKPLYLLEDVKSEAHKQLPGKFPFTRGPYPTMYAAKACTIRQ